MFYINKFLNKFWHETYLGGGENDYKHYNFCGISIPRRVLPKLEAVIPEKYDNPKVYLSIVAILKNEAPYIKEWIEYHKIVGVERFYLYDNDSTDNVREVLQSYIDSGIVCYHKVSGSVVQNKVYRDAIYKYKDQTRWMAAIDLDEFIVPIEKDNLPNLLSDYEQYPGLCVNWCMFDSNGFDNPPKENGGLVTANYLRVYADEGCKVNRHVKTIFDPKRVVSMNNPHFCYYKDRAYPVNEKFEKIKGPFSDKHVSSKIVINHYFCKSKTEYINKIMRGRATKQAKREYNDNDLNFSDWKYDYRIQKYVKKLKESLFIQD